MRKEMRLYFIDEEFRCGLCKDQTIFRIKTPVACERGMTKEEAAQALINEVRRDHLEKVHNN